MSLVLLTFFLLLLLACLTLHVFGLPGNWLLLGLVVLWDVLHPSLHLDFGFYALLVCVALAGEAVSQPSPPLQGGGYAMAELCHLDRSRIDGYLQVSGAEATAATRMLARTEGIFAGYSSGANVAAASRLLAGELRGRTVVVLLNDSGLKYLSTDLWRA